MALLSKNKKNIAIKKSLVIHIGSDRIVGVLGIFSSGDKPQISEIAEYEVKLSGLENETEFTNLFRKAVIVVAEKLVRGGNYVPDHVFASLESPWFTGQTRSVNYSKKEPFVFTQNISNNLIDEDFKRYKSEGESAFGEDLQVLDKAVISTKLNGYKIAEPFGKKTREVNISYYASLAPKFFIDNICDDLEKIVRGKIKFFSSTTSLSAALYMTISDYKKMLVISIGGEVTEILSLESGILINSGTFPYGRNHLLRTLGEELKHSPLEILSLLNMCSSGRVHENLENKIDQIVKSVEKVWRKHLRKVVHDVVGPINNGIPTMTIGNPDTLAWYKKMVSSEHISGGISTNSVNIKEWEGSMAVDFFGQKLPGSVIPPLILADCLYIYGINV